MVTFRDQLTRVKRVTAVSFCVNWLPFTPAEIRCLALTPATALHHYTQVYNTCATINRNGRCTGMYVMCTL